MRGVVWLAMVVGCSSHGATAIDGRIDGIDGNSMPPMVDAPVCTLSGQLTGTVDGDSFGALTQAHYQPQVGNPDGSGFQMEAFLVTDGHMNLTWEGTILTLTYDNQQLQVFPDDTMIVPGKDASDCWNVSVHITFGSAGGLDGVVHPAS
jgi:hypothetical protein